MAKSLKELLNLDYESLINLAKKENFGEFKDVLNKMIDSANRRIKSLLNNPIGEFSPAYKKLKDAGITKFKKEIYYSGNKEKHIESKHVSLKNATPSDTGKMLELYSNLKQFLKSKTSTVAGWQNVRKDIRERINAKKMFQRTYKSKRSATIWINREKKFWKLYNKLVDEYGGIITQLDSDRIQAMLYKIQTMKKKGKTDEMIQSVMEDYIEKLYASAQKNKPFDDLQFVEEYEKEFSIKYE